ncbi:MULTISPECIES: VirB8/TrbF family protein [Burkholderia cepacia complex]|uniref:VirB8/TrbF family protein n=1 Tax=Burkholderia cepacia complex TaxID=87882 RepID=UPI001CF23328|nr:MULTISPECIES: VirB8/TrbF family protein [Burkholderia cepacia complex]MCA8057461.1 type IV secretion system protein [Burkholderia cepacia]MDN7534648.1 VirB8/TrbF family protein [Burkholderia orbicola]
MRNEQPPRSPHIATHTAALSAPPHTGEAVAAWFAAFQRPVWEKRLAVKVALVFALIAAGECAALIVQSTHSGPRPYFVEHDEKTGAVWVSDRYAETWSATAANKRYFLVKWASRVFTIEADSQDTLARQIPAAISWTSGAATRELETYITVTDPVAQRVVQTPGLTREFVENSTSFSPDGQVAYLIFTLIESVNGKPAPPRQMLLTISFLLAPETLKPGEEKDNPIGLRITHFSITPYLGVNPGANP